MSYVSRRFDAASWWRYDDTSVTQTDVDRVRTGGTKRNGYIFVYMHQPLWQACQEEARGRKEGGV